MEATIEPRTRFTWSLLPFLLLAALGAETIQVAIDQHSFSRPIAGGPGPADFSECLESLKMSPDSISRFIGVTVGPEMLQVTCTLSVPARSECADRLLTNGADDYSGLVRGVFGSMSVNSRPIEPDQFLLRPIHTSPSEQVTELSFRRVMTGKDVSSLTFDRSAATVSPHRDSLCLALDGVRPRSVLPRPTALTDTSIAYSSDILRERPYVWIGLSLPPSSIPSGDNRSLLHRAERVFNRSPLLTMLVLLGRIMPIVLLLVATRARTADGRLQALSAALCLVIGVGALARVLADIPFYSGLGGTLSRWVAQRLESIGFAIWRQPLLGYGAKYAFVAVVGFLLGDPRGTTKGRWRGVTGRLGVVLVLAIPVILFLTVVGSGGIPRYLLALLVMSIGLLIWWGATEALYHSLHGQPMTPSRLLIVLGTPVALAGLDRFIPSGVLTGLLWILISSFLGYTVLRGILSLGPEIGGLTAFRGKRTWLVALAAAVPIGPLLRSRGSLGGVYHAGTVTAVMDLAVVAAYLVWLTTAFSILRERGKDGIGIKSSLMWAGIIAGASILVPPHPEWLGLPITYLAGTVFLTALFLRRVDGAGEVQGTTLERDARRRALDDELTMKRKQAALRKYRRACLDRLQKGELTIDEYDRNLEGIATEVGRLRPSQRYQSGLGVGPKGSSWANGMHGAAYGFVLGAPWIIVGVIRVFAENSDWLYPQTMFLFNLALAGVPWVGMGFILGYFFPLIPGHNGVSKGLMLGASIILSSLPMTALSSTSLTDSQAAITWSIQVLCHCLAIGLIAFDHYSLQQFASGEWGSIFEYLGMPAVGVAISTVGVAVGGAIVALLSDRASALVIQAIKFAVPILSSTPGAPPAP